MITIVVKCPCGCVLTNVYQPESWPKDKVSRYRTRCMKCGKEVIYQIVNRRSTSWYA